jgi:effector-binding domain-containing protein
MAGMPSGLSHTRDETAGKTDFEAGVAVTKEIKQSRKFETIVLPATKALQIDYYGRYEGSGEAILLMEEYTEAHGLRGKVPAIQEYLTDPSTEPDPKNWLTWVYHLLEE